MVAAHIRWLIGGPPFYAPLYGARHDRSDIARGQTSEGSLVSRRVGLHLGPIQNTFLCPALYGLTMMPGPRCSFVVHLRIIRRAGRRTAPKIGVADNLYASW
jgi:hypothetical protein